MKRAIYNSISDLNVDKPVTIISHAKASFPRKDRYIICADIRGTSSTGDVLKAQPQVIKALTAVIHARTSLAGGFVF